MKSTKVIVQRTFTAIILAAVSAISHVAWAQDLTIDFVKEAKCDGTRETLPKGDVIFTFTGLKNYGVSLYNTWESNKLTITSSKPIAVIEFKGVAAKGSNMRATTGTLTVVPDGTSVWHGSASNLDIIGNASDTNYRISHLRLWYNESSYVPNTEWKDEEDVTEDINYADFDLENDDTDYTTVERHFALPKSVPTDGKPVRMAVVGPRKYQNTMKDYLVWKTQQGYDVCELFTDDVLAGVAQQNQPQAIRHKLMEMNPQPSYVLLVGNENDVPVFYGTSPNLYDRAADFYYGEFTGDHHADAHVGRFSVSNATELKTQLDKTRYMAMIDPKEGNWLTHSLVVDNADGDISIMKRSVELAQKYPLNFENNHVDTTGSASTTAINTYINNGCSFVSYFGHGLTTNWNNNYYTSNVNSLTNRNRYPVVLSITCYTGTFDLPGDCLAEAFMNKNEGGAVVCIGASYQSGSVENTLLFTGGNNYDKTYDHLGLYRSLFPKKGSDPSQRARTIGEALEMARFAVLPYNYNYFVRNLELYQLFGDPTYQPYITIPKQMSIQASTSNVAAGKLMTVQTAPDAVVCVSREREIIAVALADKTGKAVLSIPASTTPGQCTLYSSAPGYNDLMRNMTITAGSGTQEGSNSEESVPAVTYTDIISLATAGGTISDNWPTSAPQSFSAQSGAAYKIWAATEYYDQKFRDWDNAEAPHVSMYMHNNDGNCGFVTTKSVGNVRTVSADWKHVGGQDEKLAVFGRKTAYSSTAEAWSNPGTLLGVLRKGDSRPLVVEGNYPYIAVRADNYSDCTTAENSVFLKSLSIGWDVALEACEKPEVDFTDGCITFSCATPGATYTYGIVPVVNAYGVVTVFTLNVRADAPEHTTSETASLNISLNELAALRGDINDDGHVSIADVTSLIKSLIK